MQLLKAQFEMDYFKRILCMKKANPDSQPYPWNAKSPFKTKMSPIVAELISTFYAII